MTHARLSVACLLLFLLVLFLLLYFVRDFWRSCLWGSVIYVAMLVGLTWYRRWWEAAFRFLALTFPVFLILAAELGIAANHYARSLSDEWAYPSAEREADSVAKELIRTNPRRRVFGIPVHHPIASEHFNINDDGYRTPPFTPKGEGIFRIIVVGGSTVFGTDVADRNTLPSRLQALYRRRYPQVEVINLGQEFLALELELEAVRRFAGVIEPDLVVFYHGANDYYYTWEQVMQPAPTGLVLEDTIVNRLAARFRDSYLVASIRRLIAPSAATEARAADGERLIAEAVGRYAALRENAEAYCRHERLSCVFFLQPYITNKAPLTYTERVRMVRDLTAFPGFGALYDRVCAQLLARFPNTGDLRGALSGLDETVFSDLVHINGSGNGVMAEAIFDSLSAAAIKIGASGR